MSLKIAIIGAGPAGCMLARLLLGKPEVNVTVFESERSVNYRAQGGSLDLHEKGGLAAIKAAGLYREFLKYARFDGEALLVCDEKLKPYIQLSPTTEKSSRGRPEIDRSSLRRMLIESLPPNIVQWNRRLSRVSESPSGHSHSLEFTDGTTESGFDLIVGADGAWSKVRSALSDTEPSYAGIGGFSVNIPDAKSTAPECVKMLKGGSIFAYSTGCMLSAQQLGDESINMGLWRAREKGWEKHVDFELTNGPAVRGAQKREYSNFAPELVNFIDKAVDDTRMAPRSFYTLPVGFTWNHKPGLTLIGDSAHVICPFTGEGVNQALTDALHLSEAVLRASSASMLDGGIQKFECELFARAAIFQERAAFVAHTMFFTEGSPATTIEPFTMQNIKNFMSPTQYKLLYPLLVTGVYCYFFWHKRFRK